MAEREWNRKREILELAAASDPLPRLLVPVLEQPTGVSSAGFPYLQQGAWEWFRDRVPHLLGMGERVLEACDLLVAAFEKSEAPEEEKKSARDAATVVRQVVLTAAITAPPDLWLLRHVLGAFASLGLLRRLLEGEALYPERCEVELEGKTGALDPDELDKDLHFLLSRGLVEQYDEGFRIAGHPRVRDLFTRIEPLPPQVPASATGLWSRLFGGGVLANEDLEILLDLGQGARRRVDLRQNHWIPDRDELGLGYRLLPVVLGLRASDLTSALVEGAAVRPEEWSRPHPVVAAAALEVLTASGWMRREGESYRVTTVGGRGFAKGPGPFGIIETYHPYMQRCREILLHGRSSVHVNRSENVGASQDANRATFEQANDALDRFCRDTGFRYGVFIEHAIGRGEATRQRYARSGDALHYVGADLEDAAIDAAMEEQKRGVLPKNMIFVRHADIGCPQALLSALRSAGLPIGGAVMLVGNGFHEARGQTDESMVEVFRGYHEAGFVLLFTEESALSIDDLRATAWNTYHAGFKYVHDKSGQALRPAEPSPRPARLGRPMLAPWSECARRAGYVRADPYCTRTRTVYPYPPKIGFNPAISVNHFFVPSKLAKTLPLSP
jgi:hypothetical protein